MARIVRQNAPPRQTRRKRTTAQIKAQAELEAARAADASRLRETRRKVVIGNALIGLARHDPDAARLLERLKRSVTRPVNRKLFDRCCQTNSNQSQFAAECVNLSGTKLTPLGESGGPCLFEVCPFGERAFLVEVI